MDAEPDPRISSRSQFKGKIVKIKYYDHIEFRRYELNRVSPVLREAVGWLAIVSCFQKRRFKYC
ncbi:MAG: hypothetical protein ACPLZF_03295 [Nitrososphaeria archaeon]